MNWDSLTIGITIVCCLIFVALIVLGIYTLEGWRRWLAIAIGVFCLVVPLLLCPLSATKHGDRLVVKHLLHQRTIALSDYEVSYYPEGYSLKGFWRKCASGGLMGYWGLWSDAKGKNYTFYLTNRKKDVALLIPKEGLKRKRILINVPKHWLEA